MVSTAVRTFARGIPWNLFLLTLGCGLFALGGLYADLEDALKKSIDVVTTGSLKYNKDEAFLENLRKDRVLLYELS